MSVSQYTEWRNILSFSFLKTETLYSTIYYYNLNTPERLAWVIQKVDNTILRLNHYSADIAWFVLSIPTHWIAIYPVDSVIQPSDNWSLEIYSIQ